MNKAVKSMNTKRMGRHVLTDKQLKYLQGRIQGMSKKEAKEFAHYSPAMAPSSVEREQGVQNALRVALEKVGVTDGMIADKLKNGLSSKKTIYSCFEGRISDEKEVPDNDVQHRYVRTILEIRGDLQSGQNMQVNLGLIGLHSPTTNVEEWNNAPTEK